MNTVDRLKRQVDAAIAKYEKAKQDAIDGISTHNGKHFQAQYRKDRKDWTVRRKGNGSDHVLYIADRKEAVKVVGRLDTIVESIIALSEQERTK